MKDLQVKKNGFFLPTKNRCGITSTVWMNGEPPSLADGAVITRSVTVKCFFFVCLSTKVEELRRMNKKKRKNDKKKKKMEEREEGEKGEKAIGKKTKYCKK